MSCSSTPDAGAILSFMSSHVLSEVERVCDRIGLLRRGELALVWRAVDDVRRMAARQVRITFREAVTIGAAGLEGGVVPNDCGR